MSGPDNSPRVLADVAAGGRFFTAFRKMFGAARANQSRSPRLTPLAGSRPRTSHPPDCRPADRSAYRQGVFSMPTKLDMAKFAKFCKDMGFIYQSSEIYGGINGFWDYGPL